MNNITLTLDNNINLYIDVESHPLAVKWFEHFKELIKNQYFLEKNYCFLGYPESQRNGDYLSNEITKCVTQVNTFFSGQYRIDREFTLDTLFDFDLLEANQEQLNWLHRYFEELQGISVSNDRGSNLSNFYKQADGPTKLAIRRLNLLCHEFESWATSYRKLITNPEWIRPSQLMCWLHAPRFELEDADFEAFGVEKLCRETGGVYIGVNKAIGKTHYEVFHDEQDNANLTTIAMRPQTLAAGDFDIEWGFTIDPVKHEFKRVELEKFRAWLIKNGYDPENKLLGIGHPKVAQVNLLKSFGTSNWVEIYQQMKDNLNVVKITAGEYTATYPYNWQDSEYDQQQIKVLYNV